jgi:hypothetical protein
VSPTHESRQEESTVSSSDDVLALAQAIHEAGMSSVATFMLGVLKPLHWFGGQALWVLQPFVETPSAGSRHVTGAGTGAGDCVGTRALSVVGVARLLEREGGLDELASYLDILESERESDRKQSKGG